ncbi:MAG: metallophosphoesterase [Clostridiales bacterium]|nr:metallophosphoesterase [Clostridiales bacterium]
MKTTKLTFITDLHYYSPSLGVNGEAYEIRSGSDQKCLAESGAIIDSAFEKIKNSDTDAVIICGDITNNGETVCHKEIKEKLIELQKSKPVYLITSTHDYCSNGLPNRYEGEKVIQNVEVMKESELRSFYYNFGPKQSSEEYINENGTSSYCVEIGSTAVLCLNDDHNGEGKSGFGKEHYDWIEKTVFKAKNEAKIVIAVEHHLAMPHVHPLVTVSGQMIANNYSHCEKLAGLGIKLIITGHSHIQRTTRYVSPKGNTIYQINAASLVGTPGTIVNITINENEIEYEVTGTDCFEYNGETYNTTDYLNSHFENMVDNLINSFIIKDKSQAQKWLNAFGMGKINKYRNFIKPLAKAITRIKVGSLCRTVNIFTFGKAVDKTYIPKYKDESVYKIIKQILTEFFNGSKNSLSKEDDFYKLIMSVVSVPQKLFPKKVLFQSICECVDNILTGGEFNHINGKIKL